MDFPTAWEIAGAADLDDHDPRCSYVQTSGGLLCDCHVLTGHPQYIADYGTAEANLPAGEPVEIVFVGALANPTIEVVYERDGDEWQASSPQISRMDERDPSFDVLDSRVRARMAEWARPEVQVTYTTRSEGARDA